MSSVTSWLNALGCPSCQRPLQPADGGARLLCDACPQEITFCGPIPLLARTRDQARFAELAGSYRRDRLRDGWRPLSREQALRLPFSSPPGYPPLYWQVRRQTFRTLARILVQQGPDPALGPVADLGAGSGWLAFRLAEMGYRALAVDASLDDLFGLRAGAPYVELSAGRMLLAQGDLTFPPLQRGRWAMVVFNASLHYAVDLCATLERAASALCEGGRLVVLDSPIGPRPVRGSGKGDRHLGRHELTEALSGAGLSARWNPIWRGPRWWAYRARSLAKRSAPFSFPLVIAGKDGTRARI